MSIDSMEKLFVEELKDLHSAEQQIIRALPKMAKAASSSGLKNAFESHLKETRGHVERLDRIFGILQKNPKGKSCAGMKGLLEEGSEEMKETAGGEVKDAAMISAAQRVEHYEIAAYGTARAYAELLQLPEAAQLLRETLEEEKAADEKLTAIAKDVNVQAKRAA